MTSANQQQHAGGNVPALLVCVLLCGMDRRSGPVWRIAVASLKATLLLLVAHVVTSLLAVPSRAPHGKPNSA